MPGEAWVDTVNNGAWDGPDDKEVHPHDNSGAPLIPLDVVTFFLGVSVGPVTAVAIGATGVIATFAGFFARR